MSTSRAAELKEEGNRHFKNGDFAAAEGLYSKAIIQDPKNAQLYTNRAMARLRLSLWDTVVADCETCLSLSPNNMKAHYYLSQAQLALGDHDAGLTHSRRAYELCAAGDESDRRSLTNVAALMRRCRKERWDWLEKHRARRDAELEDVVASLVEREAEKAMAQADGEEQKVELAAEWEDTKARLTHVFDAARAPEERKRVVPEWAVDDITFEIMVDPVVTKSGKSYERSSLVEHLKRSKTDPLTREPLHEYDIHPNRDLKQAIEEFLDENGWAVDW